jgi:tetratricopeptide (TPR) repeat protein
MSNTSNKIRRRRWIIFGCVALFLVVSVGGLYGYRKIRINRHIDGLKDEGYVALEEGNAAGAYHMFRGYLSRHPEDPQALKGLAEALQATDPGQRGDPSELINIYQRLLVLEPENRSVRSELMDLYHKINFAKEAIDLADAILEEDETNVRAREIRALQHARLRQYTVAVEECKRLLAFNPEHLDIRLLLLQLMVQNGALDTDVIAWGGDLSDVMDWGDERPEYDPQSTIGSLVQGYAHQLVGDRQQAITYYKNLASGEIEEVKVIRLLAGLFEQVGLPDEALALLNRAATELKITEIRPELCRRLWERYRAKDVLAVYGDDPSVVLSEPGSYPFVVYALKATNQQELAKDLIEQGESSDEIYIKTWAGVFAKISQAAKTDAKRKELLKETQTASDRYPADAHLRAEYAQQLLQSRYTEEALAQWEQVASDAAGWSRPMQSIAEIMLATQRDAMALEPAKAAIRRAPNLLQGVLTYFRAASANLDRLSLEEFNTLRSLVEKVQAEVESEALVPLTIELTARGQGDEARKEALQQLDAAIADQPEYALGTWIALIRINQRHGLERSAELIDLARKQYGVTPELAVADTIEVMSRESSDKQKSLTNFDRWMAEADTPDALPWQMARARLERATDPSKTQAIWKSLLQQFPEEQIVRVQVLQDEANWREEDLKLVRSVLSQQSADATERELAPVRIARARLMLTDAESDSELAETASFLIETSRDYPYLSEPYTLLGICYERQGNRSRAIDAYTSAHRIRPGSDALLSSRIRLYRELGDVERAQNLITQYADQLSKSAAADPARLAQTFAMIGDLKQATLWAQRAFQNDTTDRPSALLLARLYLASGREADAENIYKGLLETPDLNAIIAAASFYMQIGRQEDAAALIARLDELDLQEDTRAVVKGHFDLTTGDVDSAMVQYQKAADRGDALHAKTAFARLISIKISQGDLNGVMQLAKAASKKLPEEERFKAIAENEVLIRSVYDPVTAPFLQRLLVNPDQRPVVEAALRIVRSMASLSKSEQRTEADAAAYKKQLASLRRLADQNQRLVELQNLLVRKYIEHGLSEQAIEIAARTTQMFPRNQSVLIAAADANMAAQRWDSAAQVGNQIAELNPSYQAAADIVSARAALRRGLPNEALRLMASYLDMAAQLPERYEPIIRVHVAAMIAANRKPQDLGALKQAVSGSEARRTYVLDQVIAQKTSEYAAASEWIKFAMAGQQDTSTDNANVMKIKAATAWHITGIRDPEGRGADEASAILASLAANPELKVQSTLFKAIFAEERGELELAESGYREVLGEQPENLIALNNLASVLVKLGKSDEALAFAQRAAKGAPGVPIILDTLANAQIAAGQAVDAEQTIERAINLDPKSVPWHITLCRALMAKQDPGAASQALQTYQRIGDLINASDQLDSSLSEEYLSLRSELDQLLGSSTTSPTIND